MPSFFEKLKSRAEAIYQSGHKHNSVKYANVESNEQSCVRTRNARSMAYPAACRGLYGVSVRQRRMDSPSIEDKQSSCESEDIDSNDPIIKYSMYPQMVGKRRSELEALVRDRTMNHSRARTGQGAWDLTSPIRRPVRRQHSARRVRRPRSVDSEDSYDSETDSEADYSSSESSEGRPVRVCMYPQARYIKEPVTESSSTFESPTPRTPSYRNWKRDHLPYDEYQILRRRQVMQCARDVLEPHYFHQGAKPKKGLIGHGETQCFIEYHTERRRISRTQFAVRKAMQADLDPFSNAFSYAMTRHAQKERFCELSDADGAPIDEQLMWNFIRMYRRARDEAYEIKAPKLAMVRPDEVALYTSNNVHNEQTRQNVLRQLDSGATVRARVQRPLLSSRFSWESSNYECETAEHFTDSEG